MTDGVRSLTGLADSELADYMRGLVTELNRCSEEGHKRELVTAYRVKPKENAACKLAINIMTEVA